jgi:hypothetical protein
MSELPSPETLANVVDETSQAMYGMAITFAGECERGLPGAHHNATVIVPLIGAPLYIITARADDNGGSALASAMFSCETADTNAEMVEDSLRELCNIVAGQVKSLIAQDHEIGLPSRLTDDRTLHDVHQWSGARLLVGGRGNAEVDIAVAEFEGFG